jgi:hypothetical protein
MTKEKDKPLKKKQKEKRKCNTGYFFLIFVFAYLPPLGFFLPLPTPNGVSGCESRLVARGKLQGYVIEN